MPGFPPTHPSPSREPSPLFRSSGMFQPTPARPPFSVPAQTTTPIAPSSSSSSSLRRSPFRHPRFVHRAPRPPTSTASQPRGSPAGPTNRHLVTLFSSAPTATGLILRPLSRLQPPSLPLLPPSLVFTLTPLPARCQQTAPNISHDPLFLSLFSSRFLPFPPRPKRRLTVAYNCDSWYNLY